MIVAVIPIRVVQMPVNQVVQMAVVRHCFVAAVGAVLVVRCMTGTLVAICTLGWVGRTYIKGVLIHVALMRAVQVSVMEVINMIVVLNCSVAAAVSVLMRMILVNCMGSRHVFLLRVDWQWLGKRPFLTHVPGR